MVAIKSIVSSLLAGASSSSIFAFLGAFDSIPSHCNIAGDVGVLKTALQQIDNKIVPPSNLTLNFVGLAFGVQNYTCTQSNNFT
jgi:hypothetical protein